MHDHPAHDADREELHVVEQDRRVGQDHALGAGVRDVALVPQRDVLDGRARVGAQDPRETRDALGRDRVSLVGIALEPFWPARNGSSTSRTLGDSYACPGALSCVSPLWAALRSRRPSCCGTSRRRCCAIGDSGDIAAVSAWMLVRCSSSCDVADSRLAMSMHFDEHELPPLAQLLR